MVPGSLIASELATHTLDVQLQNTTLQELFDMIEEQYNYSFLIRNNDIDLNEKVSVDTSGKSVEDILKTALKNQHADFVVNNNRIIVYKTTAKQTTAASAVRQATQQESKISGVVVDAMTGEPVIGANVLVKGTTNGTITDYDGNFTLNAPVGATLAISYIGYTALEVRATAGPMNIRLAEDTKALDEVVVVGYSVQKKESLTGAMQMASGQKLNSNTNPSVENMMMGKAPRCICEPW
ncbi:MAG: carboxypeptidase-like regulatory domain-containing protein [Tannerellaceae bacterium]|nr:carboxypeptidase-like regulatory domain-containing protein [Tannerellaceae bacterium]